MFPKPQYKKKKINREYKTNALEYCQYCGRTDLVIQRHHIIKRSQGGRNEEKQRIDLCIICHVKADQKAIGFKPADLYWKKWQDKKRRKILSSLIGEDSI